MEVRNKDLSFFVQFLMYLLFSFIAYILRRLCKDEYVL